MRWIARWVVVPEWVREGGEGGKVVREEEVEWSRARFEEDPARLRGGAAVRSECSCQGYHRWVGARI